MSVIHYADWFKNYKVACGLDPNRMRKPFVFAFNWKTVTCKRCLACEPEEK
jgi:hypothetical protein